VYSSGALSRRIALATVALVFASCAGRRPAAQPPLFPLSPAWKTLLDDFVVPPLALDSRRLFVASQDGTLRALELSTGRVLWKVEGVPGRVAATDGAVLVRGEDGSVWSLQPRSGALRWKTETGIQGSLAPVLDGDRALVAGRGFAALDLSSGKTLWSDPGGQETTAPPVPAGARVLAGEKDGTLRCRDRASGVALWTLRTGGPLLAPPLVDLARRRLYVGTTDKGIIEVSLDKGRRGWRWTVGADVVFPGLLLPGRVLFDSKEAVLWALGRGGSVAWRGALPSRPLSGPLMVQGQLVVACLENEVVALSPDTGKRTGALRTSAEIRTPPVVAGSLLILGLRDRSVVAYAPPGAAGAETPAPSPVEPPSPHR
jgi:outer membrane protein assembly factor BamB